MPTFPNLICPFLSLNARILDIMRLLLLSNSGKPLYHWCKKEIADFVGDKEVTFISAATVYDPKKYYQNDAAWEKSENLLREVMKKRGCDFFGKSVTPQEFPHISHAVVRYFRIRQKKDAFEHVFIKKAYN